MLLRLLARILRVPRHDERGQMLVMFVLMLGVLIGIIGLAVDVGYFLTQRRQSQNAADAAAIAAVLRLSDGGTATSARTTAREYASANGYDNDGADNTVTVNIPPTSGGHAGDANYAEVIIAATPETFFIHVLTPGGSVQARGVAGRSISNNPGQAIYAHHNGCDKEIDWTGGGVHVIGHVHTNGQFNMSGTSNTVSASVTHKIGCTPNPTDPATKSSTFGSGPTGAPFMDWPRQYTWTDFAGVANAGCLFYSAGDLNVGSQSTHWLNNDPSTHTLKPGVYCAGGKINMSQTGVTGTVTFIARGQVRISGGNMNLTPYSHDVLLYSELVGNDAIVATGSNGTWRGIMVAPNGEVDISGSGNQVLQGALWAETVHLSGSNWSLDGTGYGLRYSEARLVE